MGILVTCLVLVGAALIGLTVLVFEVLGRLARLRRGVERLAPLAGQVAALQDTLAARTVR